MTSSENRSISIDQNAMGCTLISGDGNQVVIYQNQVAQKTIASQTTHSQIGNMDSNPYQGLLPFQETNADQYFGRDQQITQLWEKLRDLAEASNTTKILPIYGPSGSGKSSLARAGLLPRLAQKPLPGFAKLQVAVFLPSSHPLESLAMILAKAITQDLAPIAKTQEFKQELQKTNKQGEYDGLRRIASALPDVADAPLLILVDQFEEIYSLCNDSVERQAFIANLLYAASDRSSQVMILITLRSDFLGNIQKHPQLNQIFSRQGFLVPAMSEEELREAICQPAMQAGYTFDEATVNLLLEQTRDRAGSLPLLQFALTKIWEGLENGATPAETLERINGVGGALAGEAQRVFDSLTKKQQKIARRIFLGLIQFGIGNQITRRRVDLDQLRSHQDTEIDFRTVLDSFAFKGVRLITLASRGEEQQTTVEVTHEALFQNKNWPQFAKWVEEDQSDLLFQRRVQEEAERWQKMGRPDGSLWRTPDLDLLERYHQQAGEDMTTLQLEFFNSCRKAAKLRKLILMGALSLILFLFCAALISGIIAYFSKLKAELETIKTLNQTAETNLASNQPFEALVAATKAGQELLKTQQQTQQQNLTVVSQTKALLNQNLWQVNRLDGHTDEVWYIQYSQDGKLLASGGKDGVIHLWDAVSGQHKFTLKDHRDSIKEIIFSHDDQLLASRSEDGMIRLWSVKTGELIDHPINNRKNIEAKEPANSISFSPISPILAIGKEDGTVELWDVEKNQLNSLPLLDRSPHPVTLLKFSSDGKKLVVVRDNNTIKTIKIWNLQQGWQNFSIFSKDKSPIEEIQIKKQFLVAAKKNGSVQIWNLNSKKPKTWNLYLENKCPPKNEPEPDESLTKILKLSGDEKILAVAECLGIVRLWDIDKIFASNITDQDQYPKLKEENPNNIIWNLQFSPDGKTLAAAGEDNKILLWDWKTRQKQPFAILLGHTNHVASIQFSPDGKMLASASDDRTVGLWKIEEPFIPILQGHNGIVWDVSFNPQANLISSVGEDGTIRFWSLQDKSQKSYINLSIKDQKKYLLSAQLNSDNKILAVGGGQVKQKDKLSKKDELDVSKPGQIEAINMETRRELYLPIKTESPVFSLRFIPNKNILASGDWMGNLFFWDIHKGRKINTNVPAYPGAIYAIDFNPIQKQILAFAGSLGIINFWDMNANKLLDPIIAQVGEITTLKYSPDGEILASGGDTIRLWDSITHKQIATLNGHISGINSLQFNPNGKVLASASGDGEIKLWDMSNQQLLATLKGHYKKINDIEFVGQDGSILASASDDGSILLWEWNSDLEKLVSRSCKWLGNYLKYNQRLSDEEHKLCDKY
jgi:hypothetical protein